MPLFRRSDGDLVRDESPVRRMMPYVMRGRNESAVYHETTLDVSRTLEWLRARNDTRPAEDRATIFHLFLWACARVLHERPGLNRFVSGGRIYQRRGAFISFAAKREFEDGAPLVTVKLEFPAGEAFDACVRRIRAAISEGRGGKPRVVDREVRLALRLPGFLLRAVIAAIRWLDRVNLLPARMISSDPMYASIFAANLGSVGIGDTFHHLYEYGTTSVFGVMGPVRPTVFADADGRPAVRDGLQIRWTFDERINDGLYCAKALDIVRRTMEDPEGQGAGAAG